LSEKSDPESQPPVRSDFGVVFPFPGDHTIHKWKPAEFTRPEREEGLFGNIQAFWLPVPNHTKRPDVLSVLLCVHF